MATATGVCEASAGLSRVDSLETRSEFRHDPFTKNETVSLAQAFAVGVFMDHRFRLPR